MGYAKSYNAVMRGVRQDKIGHINQPGLYPMLFFVKVQQKVSATMHYFARGFRYKMLYHKPSVAFVIEISH